MNSTLILFKEIGRQLLIVGLVLGSLPMAIRILCITSIPYYRTPTLNRCACDPQPANRRSYPLEITSVSARLLLYSYKAVLAALGGSTPNSLHPAFYRLHPVFCRNMDCPLRP